MSSNPSREDIELRQGIKGVKDSELPEAEEINPYDHVAIVQGGKNKKVEATRFYAGGVDETWNTLKTNEGEHGSEKIHKDHVPEIHEYLKDWEVDIIVNTAFNEEG